jgi:hypothetical protein
MENIFGLERVQIHWLQQMTVLEKACRLVNAQLATVQVFINFISHYGYLLKFEIHFAENILIVTPVYIALMLRNN